MAPTRPRQNLWKSRRDGVRLRAKNRANVGITSFQVRRNLADVTSYQVMIEVTNFGEETAQCRLDLELEGNIVDVIPLTLEPGKPWRDTLDHISPNGGRLVAKLDLDDALAADNQAVAVLPGQDPIPVFLVTPGSLFLRSVFESIPNVALTISDLAARKTQIACRRQFWWFIRQNWTECPKGGCW